MEFCRQKTAHFNPPLANLDDYLRNKDRWQELRSQWEKENGVVHYSKDWENDPRREKWLDKIRSLGFAAFIYENDSLDGERKEFYDWANANKLIWEPEP